jgi:hypothetical protein
MGTKGNGSLSHLADLKFSLHAIVANGSRITRPNLGTVNGAKWQGGRRQRREAECGSLLTTTGN